MSGFELSRRFAGETIDCTVMVWHARFKSERKEGAAEDHRRVTVAPHATTVFGIGFGGEWKARSFHLDPQQSAIRLNDKWILISDIDAASQFTVEKEHAVAFPHESKQIYVSGHVGLHLHTESTNEAFTIAFDDFRLADVAFDAVNKLSYDQLSHEIFEGDDSSDEDDTPAGSVAGADASSGGALVKSSSRVNLHQQQQQQNEAAARKRQLAKQRKAAVKKQKSAAAAAASSAGAHDDDDEGGAFVATNGTQLVDRGRHVDTNDFTTFFLEGGGMGSNTDPSAGGGGGSSTSGNTVPPSGGIVRLRKETGSLSTWIAKMEPDDPDHLFMMKLSKAAIKAPLNRIVARSRPSVAKHIAPVVPLAFRNLTIRSEAVHAQFMLEEVYVAANGDTRVHRLICVFTSLEERMRWEDWLQARGVKKRAIETAALSRMQQGDGTGTGKADGDGGAAGGAAGGGGGANGDKNKSGDGKDGGDGKGGGDGSAAGGGGGVDVTMRLIYNCFVFEEEWAKPRRLGGKREDSDEDEFAGLEDDGSTSPFVADSRVERMVGAGMPASGSTSPRTGSALFESLRKRALSASPNSAAAAAAAAANKSSPAAAGGGGRATSPGSGRRMKDGTASPPGSPAAAASPVQAPQKSLEQEHSELEAAERCRWFSGYQAPKENKWSALSTQLRKEKSAGSNIFTAVAKLKRSSDVFGAAASRAEFDEDASRAHFLGGSGSGSSSGGNNSPTSGDSMKNKLSAMIRAGQIARAVEAIQRHKSAMEEGASSPDGSGGGGAGSAVGAVETVRAINALNELDAVEQEAMMAEIRKQQEAVDEQRRLEQAAGGVTASSLISPHQQKTPAGAANAADGPVSPLGARSSDGFAVAHSQSRAAAEIMQSLHMSPTERQQLRLKQQQGEQEDGSDDGRGGYGASGGRTLRLPSELSGVFEAQRLQAQRNRVLGSGGGGTDGSLAELPADGSMFGQPLLYADTLRPKFSRFELRSEGYVDPQSVAAAVKKNAPPPPARTPGDEKRPQHSSPAADSSRVFSFDYHSSSPTTMPSPIGGGAGATATGRADHLDERNRSAAADDGWSAALYTDAPLFAHSHQQQQQQRRLVDTSSDSDDEASRRFANARALRAVNQLGEEFVGPTHATATARNSFARAAAASASSLTGALAPTCPLCGADRAVVAICKKTGRLHASLLPRYADNTASSRSVYR